MMEAEVTKKRRLSEDDHDQTKRKVLRDEGFNFLEFSDEILMLILENLDSLSLLKVAQTCHRLRNLSSDRTFWQHVDLSEEPLKGSEIARKIFNGVIRCEDIKSLKFKGLVSKHPQTQWKNQTVTIAFLMKLAESCPQLESISIQEGCFDISQVAVKCFPPNLREFHVDRCEIIRIQKQDTYRPDKPFFSGINDHMTSLEKLQIENCNWFDTHDLIAFSKLPNLRFLSLRGCNTFKECVPYGSIATRFGFKALEVLDVRNTPVTDSDIQCFNMTKSLKELRLQCPETKQKSEVETVLPVGSDQPGPSGEAPPQPEQPQLEQRQVINLHFRRMRGGADEQNPVPAEGDVNFGGENNENGAEFQASNNVRINIRNQNVQGRNVIHIVVRNNHNCRANDDLPAAGDRQEGEQPAQPARQEEEPAPAGNNEPNNDENQREPAPAQEPAGEQGAQHYIMIRGFRENAADANEDPNPGLVQFIQFERTFPINMNANPATLITDRGICSFGQSAGNQHGVVWIRMENRSPTTSLERIVVRDYKLVTDSSLQHLSSCAPNLQFLDVIGTEVTKTGIEKFKLVKPECFVVSNFGSFE